MAKYDYRAIDANGKVKKVPLKQIPKKLRRQNFVPKDLILLSLATVKDIQFSLAKKELKTRIFQFSVNSLLQFLEPVFLLYQHLI